MSTLKLRHVAIDTYRENVVYLHRGCPLYRSEGFHALSKIEIHERPAQAAPSGTTRERAPRPTA